MSTHHLLLTTVPGLEDVAARELHALLGTSQLGHPAAGSGAAGETAAGTAATDQDTTGTGAADPAAAGAPPSCTAVLTAPWGIGGMTLAVLETATDDTSPLNGAPDDSAPAPMGAGKSLHGPARTLIGWGRSLFDLVQLHGPAALPPEIEEEEALRAFLRERLLPEVPPLSVPFRVSCNRSGTHRFQSPAVERLLGACIVERDRAPVSLEGYEREIRVDISDGVAMVGDQLNRESLDRRYEWRFRPRVALRTVVAYALLELAAALPTAAGRTGAAGLARSGRAEPAESPGTAGSTGAGASRAGGTEPRVIGAASLDAPQAILDPFCGSGTILLEAAHRFPAARLYGRDYKAETVSGARENLAAAGLEERVELDVSDARDLRDTSGLPGIELIVTNPPYGNRLHRSVDFTLLYRKFLTGAWHVLAPGGRIVMLAARRRGVLNRVLEELRLFTISHVRVIETGGVYPGLFVLDRVD